MTKRLHFLERPQTIFSVFLFSYLFSTHTAAKNEPKTWPISGEMMYLHSNFSSVNASLQFDGMISVAGKIIITSDIEVPRRVWFWVNELEAAGAVGVVRNLSVAVFRLPMLIELVRIQILVEGTEKTLGYLEMGRPPVVPTKIPIFGMTVLDFVPLGHLLSLSDIDALYGSIKDTGDVTPWREFLWSPAVWVSSIVLGTACAICFGISAFKFIQYWRHVGFKSLPCVCLLFNGLALLDMTVLWGFDPLGQRQVLTTLTSEAMRIVPIPFLGSTMLLLIFYWWETLRPTRLHFSFNIDRFRLPASIVIFIYFTVTVMSIINRSMGARNAGSSWIFKITLSVFTLPILLFFLITSIRIMRAILKTRKQDGEHQLSYVTDTTYHPDASVTSDNMDIEEEEKQKWTQEAVELEAQQSLKRAFQVATKLAGIAVCLSAVVVSGFMMLAPQFNAWEPRWTYSMWYLMHAGFTTLTMWCIAIFKRIS
jgi:hypothetical protein